MWAAQSTLVLCKTKKKVNRMQCEGFKPLHNYVLKHIWGWWLFPQLWNLSGWKSTGYRQGLKGWEGILCQMEILWHAIDRSLRKYAGCALASPGFCSCITCVCFYLVTEQIFIGELLYISSLCSIIFCLPQVHSVCSVSRTGGATGLS